MNYPAGIGNFFEEQARWEAACDYAENEVTSEYGSGDLYEIEGEIFNEEAILELINLEEDTEDNYRIDREKLVMELAEEYI